MQKKNIFILSFLFWALGAIACLEMAIKSFTLLPFEATVGKPTDPKRDLIFFSIAFVSTLVYTFTFMLPRVFIPIAIKEVERINSLETPCWHHFYDKKQLIMLLLFIPALSLVTKHFEYIYIVCLLNGAMVFPVSMGLSAGAVSMGKEAWKQHTGNQNNDDNTLLDNVVV